MSLTYYQARDEMLTLFYAAWSPTGYQAHFENTKEASPEDQPWCRVRIRHVTGRQATLSGGNGDRSYERTGVLAVQIFAPIGKGLQKSYELAKVLADAFEGAQTDGGVWFRDVRLNEIGRDGNFFQVNLLADFRYDEVK